MGKDVTCLYVLFVGLYHRQNAVVHLVNSQCFVATYPDGFILKGHL